MADDTPRLMDNLFDVTADAAADAAGALWRLQTSPRQLDANVIRLAAGGRIDAHAGPDLDVLMLVLDGSGRVAGDATDPIAVEAGALVWLPRRSRREIAAGPDGLAYLTVHRHRNGLAIGSR